MKDLLFDDVWNDIKDNNVDVKGKMEVAEQLSRVMMNLVENRVSRGMSQRDIAAKCGLTQSAIARMETLSVVPRLDTLIKYANALKLSLIISNDTAVISRIHTYVKHEEFYNSEDYSWKENIQIGEVYGIPS